MLRSVPQRRPPPLSLSNKKSETSTSTTTRMVPIPWTVRSRSISPRSSLGFRQGCTVSLSLFIVRPYFPSSAPPHADRLPPPCRLYLSRIPTEMFIAVVWALQLTAAFLPTCCPFPPPLYVSVILTLSPGAPPLCGSCHYPLSTPSSSAYHQAHRLCSFAFISLLDLTLSTPLSSSTSS